MKYYTPDLGRISFTRVKIASRPRFIFVSLFFTDGFLIVGRVGGHLDRLVNDDWALRKRAEKYSSPGITGLKLYFYTRSRSIQFSSSKRHEIVYLPRALQARTDYLSEVMGRKENYFSTGKSSKDSRLDIKKKLDSDFSALA